MELLAPLYLAAAAAAAVPLWLHLRRWRTERRVVFPAIRYLREAQRALAQRLQLRHWLLLASRIALVLLAALLAAGLLFGRGDARDHPPTRIAIALDPSASTGLVEGDHTVFDLLRERALQTLALAGPEDDVWIVRATEPEAVLGPLAPHEATARLAEVAPVPAAADLVRAVAAAAAVVGGGGPAEVHLLSDLQVSNLGAGPEARDVPLILFGPAATTPSNLALTDLRAAHSPVAAGEEPLVLARLERFGGAGDGEGEADATVRATVEGRVVSLASATPGSDVTLVLPAATGGWISGTVEIDPSGLRADDRRFFTLPVREPPRVAVAGEPGPFVEASLAALESGGRLRRAAAAASADVVWSAGGEGLEDATRAGRTVIVAPPEDPLALPRLNARLERRGIPWRFALESGRGLGRLAAESTPVPGLRGLIVRIAHRLEPTAPGRTRVWLRLESGEPWLVSAETPASGPTLILASPLTAAGTELVSAPAMVPFVDALVSGWAGGADPLGADGARGISLPSRATAVERPSGASRTVEGGGYFRDVDEAGIYRVLAGDSILRQVAVNAPAEESDLARASDGAVQRLFPEARIVRGGATEDWERAIFRVRRGRDAAPLLLALLVGLALAETALAAAGRDRPPKHG